MRKNQMKRAICSIGLAVVLGIGAVPRCVFGDTPSSNLPAQIPGGADFKSLGYAQIGSNDSGRALYSLKAGTSAKAAMIAAMHDVEKILGTKVTISGAFVDQKDDHSGGANFAATISGTAVKGSVLVGIGDNGAAVSVLYATANVPANDWSQLLADLPASIKLTDTPFGDGVGTIGLPDGWTVASSNNMGTVIVVGPEQEQLILQLCQLVLMPGSQGAVSQQNVARLAVQYHVKPVAGYPIAPYSGPADALKNIFPWYSYSAVLNGGPKQELQEIIAAKPVGPTDPANQTAMVYFRANVDTPGQPTVRRCLAQLNCQQLQVQGEWGFNRCSASALDSDFDKELPTMLAVWNSYKVDVQKAIANGQADTAAVTAIFQQAQANMKAMQDQTDQMLADSQARQLASDRSFADEDELIRGYRTVEDTQTGEQADVNLGDSTAIVNKLNEGDPGRYIEIPLRDTVDPF